MYGRGRKAILYHYFNVVWTDFKTVTGFWHCELEGRCLIPITEVMCSRDVCDIFQCDKKPHQHDHINHSCYAYQMAENKKKHIFHSH
jgi:hypothetical protein